MGEPNSALTYGDLILAVAEQLGLAYYGAAGTDPASVPIDPFTLDKCKRYVQDGIRMFMADGPPNGWRWQRPLAEIDLWQEMGIAMPTGYTGANYATSAHITGTTHVYTTAAWFSVTMVGQVIVVRDTGIYTIAGFVSSNEVTLTPGTDYSWSGGKTFIVVVPAGMPTMTGVWDTVHTTTITAPTGTFYPSTEGKTLFVTNEAVSRTLGTYIDNMTMTIYDTLGTQAWTGSKTFNLSSQGLYALPQNFGGETAGEITYQAGSNRGVPINWTSELEIRRLRENWNSVSGNPYYAAVRRNNTNSRRWELYIYPNTGGTYRVEFPFLIYFDKIVNLTDMHVAGFQHDEAVKAAAMAAAERQAEDMAAGSMAYYRQIALPDSLKIDARAAARNLGYNANPRAITVRLRDARQYMRRLNVQYRP